MKWGEIVKELEVVKPDAQIETKTKIEEQRE